MIAVQTLNLYKYYNNGDNQTIKLQLLMSLMSSFLLGKYYDKVILYCDQKTSETLANSYYTEIRILPSNILAKHNYGTLSKLYTYSNVEDEYIHFDIDYFLFKKLELKDELICAYSETKEKCGEHPFNLGYVGLIDKLKSNYDDFGFNVVNENYAMNFCVFGVPKKYHKPVTDYFKRLNEYTEKNIESIVNTYTIEAPPHWAIEQYISAQYFLENEFKIRELNEYENPQIKGHSGHIRIYEMEKFTNIANFRINDIDVKSSLLNYMEKNIGHHLWVSKSVTGMDELLLTVVNEMYPELYLKIESILNIKTKKRNTLI